MNNNLRNIYLSSEFDEIAVNVDVRDSESLSDFGLVSILMPAFNSKRYIRGAIDSVLKQTYPFFELIVVDACSLPHRKEAVL